MEDIFNIINKYHVLKAFLNQEFIKNIKLLYVFNNNVFIVTNDDKTYVFGSNSCGILGLGNENEVNELTIVKELCHKQIIDFKNSWFHMIGRTIDGKVYVWGCNRWGILGNGRDDLNPYYRQELNEVLKDKRIITIK